MNSIVMGQKVYKTWLLFYRNTFSHSFGKENNPEGILGIGNEVRFVEAGIVITVDLVIKESEIKSALSKLELLLRLH